MSKWYVIQVFGGEEQRACDLIVRHAKNASSQTGTAIAGKPAAPPAFDECFVPRCQVERKFKGEWRVFEQPVFSGYVIVITRNIGRLNSLLKTVPTFTRLLGSENSFVPLDPAEQALINMLTTEGHRTLCVSRGVYEGDAIVVTEGPLVGHEGMIVSANRRKGTCRVRLDAFGRTLEVEVGLAIVGRR